MDDPTGYPYGSSFRRFAAHCHGLYTCEVMLKGLLVATALLLPAFGATTASGLAQASPAPSSPPAPAASPTPGAPSDPCGSILSIVNRPVITTGVCTVRTGHFDVETGYANTTTTGTGGGSSVTYPQAAHPHWNGQSALRRRVGAAELRYDVGGNAGGNRLRPTRTSVRSSELGYSSNAVWGVNGLITFPTGKLGILRRKHLSSPVASTARTR